ncbi:MAG: hypothetical protein QNJ47_00070 [Nostocaceae cyanobacterium]|nr:hypothetical protein [Nostocaceae cyanobacterium]
MSWEYLVVLKEGKLHWNREDVLIDWIPKITPNTNWGVSVVNWQASVAILNF